VFLIVYSSDSKWLYKGKNSCELESSPLIAGSLCLFQSQLMSSTSFASLLFITNSDTDKIKQNTTVCDTSKPPSPPPFGGS